MARTNDPARLWKLIDAQHGVVSWDQLRESGLSKAAIEHRLRTGRLHRLHVGVYAVGRRRVSRRGRWMAAVLACGPGAVLSFGSAAALLGIERERRRVEVTIPRPQRKRHPGILAHRPMRLDDEEVAAVSNIPVTDTVRTLVDLASVLPRGRLEGAVSAADQLGLATPEHVRRRLGQRRESEPRGTERLRRLLDRATFALTDSDLERRFLALVRTAGLPRPQTGMRLHGFKVDFFWPALGLVVETDGLRYHRTPTQQARDRRRDQTLTKAGFTVLRFTDAQVRYDGQEAISTLSGVVSRLVSARRVTEPRYRRDE